MTISTIFFDIGGVLGTNGWDGDAREAAVHAFDLDGTDFEYRHHDAIVPWEEGLITMDEYLDQTVFYETRPFTREEFQTFMLAQSMPNVAMINVVRALAQDARYRLLTLNNESAELNAHRIRRFRLHGLFDAFLSSCYLAARKPLPLFYHRALGVAQADPAQSVFIDDREQNLIPARGLGLHTIHYTSATDVCAALAALGVHVTA